MNWLQSIDTSLFRFFNRSLVNPVFDWLMPLLAGHPLFIPCVAVTCVWLFWKGGRRGRVFVLMLALSIGVADGLVSNTIKKAVARPRPCITLPDTRLLLGCSGRGSMPSSHAANSFAAAMVICIYYRRARWVAGIAAGAVAFSRVYNGVHYPADVLAGAILGAGSACAVVWSLNAFWWRFCPNWFPDWYNNCPSLVFLEDKNKRDIQL